uniref:DDE Tnp4 domain-containing protein n=1 Tax=Cyprinus carpio TaxID=7962 RepID=A0A8C2CC38_CYPCA
AFAVSLGSLLLPTASCTDSSASISHSTQSQSSKQRRIQRVDQAKNFMNGSSSTARLRKHSKLFPKPTEDMWRFIASKFWSKWNFPNSIGAIDGKHVNIVAPAHSGSLFFKFKKAFSIVLLALVDADYKFTFIQVGDFGRASDGGVYQNSSLGRGVEAKTLRIFNCRLSRARMVVECTFGILSSRWRVLHTRLNVKPENADYVVMATCILHNYLMNPSQNQRWLDEAEEIGNVLPPVRNMCGNRGSREAYNVRERFCTFFCSPEVRVSWQDQMV